MLEINQANFNGPNVNLQPVNAVVQNGPTREQTAELRGAVISLWRLYEDGGAAGVNMPRIATLITGERANPGNTATLNQIITNLQTTNPALAAAITRLRNAVSNYPAPLTLADFHRIYREYQKEQRSAIFA